MPLAGGVRERRLLRTLLYKSDCPLASMAGPSAGEQNGPWLGRCLGNPGGDDGPNEEQSAQSPRLVERVAQLLHRAFGAADIRPRDPAVDGEPQRVEQIAVRHVLGYPSMGGVMLLIAFCLVCGAGGALVGAVAGVALSGLVDALRRCPGSGGDD